MPIASDEDLTRRHHNHQCRVYYGRLVVVSGFVLVALNPFKYPDSARRI
jgi:hypothetical protein